MTAIPPPEGMTEEDYDSIHAAVVETVRGRWFLAEYARRSRVDEVKEMLAAIGRLEKVVTGDRALPPPANVSPHLRLLAQRADEIATRLSEIADDLRDSGADPYLCDDLDAQVRAIASLPKGRTSDPMPSQKVEAASRIALEAPAGQLPDHSRELTAVDPALKLLVEETANAELGSHVELQPAEPILDPIEPEFPASSAPMLPPVTPFHLSRGGEDPGLAALAAIDGLPLREKLALFS
jgi:hypothetical protein